VLLLYVHVESRTERPAFLDYKLANRKGVLREDNHRQTVAYGRKGMVTGRWTEDNGRRRL